MGSSTAVGSGASSYQFSWAGRLQYYYNKNTSDGLDTIFYNIARGGYHTYNEVSSDCIPPLGRPAPDPLCNVSMALSYNPDVVIINLPSNDIGAGFSIAESMNNFRLMYNNITATGAKCYISTTQPRNDYSILQRKYLQDMADSINTQFGYFAVDFWNDLVTQDGQNMLRADRKETTSSIHANDLGHDFLFNKIKDKNIFGISVLPIKITGLGAQIKDEIAIIQWRSEQQLPNTLFEVERSANGRDFETAFKLTVAEARQTSGYTAIDKTPLPGINFYRIKVTESSHYFYSNTISVINKISGIKISKLYKDNSSGNLITEFNLPKNQQVLITIVTASGILIQQKKQYVSMPTGRLILPLSNLAAGQYFIKISTEDNSYSIKSFFR